MAKETKEVKETKATKVKPVPPAPETYKYGMPELEAATGLKAPSIRVGLRDSTFTKAGRSWGWNTKAEFDLVLKYFKERQNRAPDMTKAAKPAEKPAKAARAPKAAKAA